MLSRASLVVGLSILLAYPSRAAASDDYDPTSSAWNGLAGLVGLAARRQIPIATPSSVDVAQLAPGDALIVVFPTEELPLESLASFMQGGGQVVVADDFGRGEPLLSLYDIRRERGAPADSARLRGNDNLPVARPRLRHELAVGVTALVANHPATVRHDELAPVFAFDDDSRGLVLTGTVGDGRLVTISDPSVLINNMLRFRGNQRFAENLVDYLAARGGRLLLVTRDTPIRGRFGDDAGGRPIDRVQAWLSDFASADAPPIALLLAAVVIAAIFLVIAVSALPRRSPYDGREMFPRPAVAGGFAGRVEFFRRRPEHLLHPLLVYKFELEGELIRALDLPGRALLRDVTEALRGSAVPEADIERLRQLLIDLDELRRRQDHPPGPPRISATRFAHMVQTGEQILARIEGRAER